jgi:hypothetical protein
VAIKPIDGNIEGIGVIMETKRSGKTIAGPFSIPEPEWLGSPTTMEKLFAEHALPDAAQGRALYPQVRSYMIQRHCIKYIGVFCYKLQVALFR